MAEFRIQRFKHTWKNIWNSGVTYNSDDVISLGGKVYNCLVRHQSSQNFYQDLNFQNTDTPPVNDPKWELMADGVSIRGNWTTEVEYFIGDIVKSGSVSYICVENHVSSPLSIDFFNDFQQEGYWILFLNSSTWLGEWTTSSYYNTGDVLKYAGIVYRCIQDHTATDDESLGLLTDSINWEIYTVGNAWTKDWQPETIYYQRDIVRYGGIVYRCVTQHTSRTAIDGLEIDIPNWDIVVSATEFRNNWQASEKYRQNDIVRYGPYLYICTAQIYVIEDEFNNEFWSIFCPGQEFENNWAITTLYRTGEIVKHGGYLFVATALNLESTPSVDVNAPNSDWELLFKGTRTRGDWDSTSIYLAGDVVRRNGRLYAAKKDTPAGEDTDLIDQVNSVNSEFWELLVPSVAWRGNWELRRTYLIGDLALWRGAAYRCVVKHLSGNSNRPDQNQNNWEQYTYGDPENQLSFVGDLKTFGIREDGITAGSVRLPIGTDAQTLQVVETTSAWSNFNTSNSVYYVSSTGVDRLDRGTTSNAAWRTVRYALEHITGPATLFVRTGTYYEVLPLKVPRNVAVVGDELRSTVIAPVDSKYSSNAIAIFVNWIDYLDSVITDVVLKQTITSQLGEGFQTFDNSAGTSNQTEYITARLILIKQLMIEPIGYTLSSTNVETTDTDVLSAIAQVNNNREFLQLEFLGFLKFNYPGFVIDINEANAIVERLLNAIVYDLTFTGNYQAAETGRYFYNSWTYGENKKQNMFLFSNGSGLRNLTLKGLTGELGPRNEFLTRRPSAGAYASLDAGWGIDDTTVWIDSKSPYIQNVSTFGTGCVGLKIDGALHAGGNKSIVSNDFTQILSDGIGIWCNKDGLTEAVSVFTYYNHVGYLSTDGGKIRGANGNCSYGTFGASAEGFNTDETVITAKVNNRSGDATVDQTVTTGQGRIRKFFFDHSGQDYTSANFNIVGAGLNAEVLVDEFRDQAIFESRLFAPGDSSLPGGSGYTLLINNAQIGTNNEISLATSTDFQDSDLQGLRVSIETGTGSGQYGYIASWNNLTKKALIGNEFYEQYQVTETTLAGNALILDSTVNLKVNDSVCFSGEIFGAIESNKIYYINSITPTQITVRDIISPPASITRSFVQPDSGTTIFISFIGHLFTTGDIIEVGTGVEETGSNQNWQRQIGQGTASGTVYTITMTAHGLVDQDTYRIEFATGTFQGDTAIAVVVTVLSPDTFTFTGPPTALAPDVSSATVSEADLVDTEADRSINLAGIAIQTGATYTISIDVDTFDYVAQIEDTLEDIVASLAVLINATVTYTASVNAVTETQIDITAGAGTSVIVLTSVAATPDESVIIRLGFRPTAGKYTVTVVDENTISVTTSDLSYTLGSVTFSFGGDIELADAVGSMELLKLGWNHYQPGTQIVPLLDTTARYRIEPRLIFDSPTRSVEEKNLGQSADWSDVTYGNDLFVAVSGFSGTINDAAAYSEDGLTWTPSVLPSGIWSRVKYGNGIFVAVSKDGKIARTTDGIDWTTATAPTLEYTGLVYGEDTWIAIAGGTDKAIKSTNGIDWIEFSLGEGADWSDIAYGKGVFVAIAEGDSASVDRAYSTDGGQTWTTEILGGGAKTIAYGNDRFVVVAGGYAGASETYISFDGVNWFLGSITPANWQRVSYGQGKFVAVAYSEDFIAESNDGIDWFSVATGSYNCTSIFFGNPANTPVFIVTIDGTSSGLFLKRGTQAQGRLRTSSGRATGISLWEQGSGYTVSPAVTIIDPNNLGSAIFDNRIASRIIGNPSIKNPGIGWISLSTRVTVTGDGFADRYQLGNRLIIQNATRVPGPGANLLIDEIFGFTYRVLAAKVISTTSEGFNLDLTITKPLQVDESPDHLISLIMREQYSQVRLTGHDFLDIGLGNFEQTNYPNTLFPVGTVLAPQDEAVEHDGGRVFYTSTNQDGNFRVGDLFAVEQATGTVTISAEFFQLDGLEELAIGGVSVGSSGVVIREFSTDPLFVADSNNVIPTQRAIREFIARRVSGGGSDAFTGNFTAGVVSIGPRAITTVTGQPIEIPVKVAFNAPLGGNMLINSIFMAGTGFVDED